MAAFAEQLKALRSARKLTQIRLAELLNVDPRVYNRWERGTAVPQLDTVVKIAQLLQVSLDELVGLEPASSAPAIHNPKLAALYQEVDKLSDEDQQALVVLMDSLIKRSQISKLLVA